MEKCADGRRNHHRDDALDDWIPGGVDTKRDGRNSQSPCRPYDLLPDFRNGGDSVFRKREGKAAKNSDRIVPDSDPVGDWYILC